VENVNNLDALLIFPNNRRSAYGGVTAEIAAVTPPVQCGLLAAYLRSKGFSVDVLDADARGCSPEQAGQIVATRRPRLVVISTDHVNSADVTKMGAAGETARAIHAAAPDVPVLLEGVVPSAYPERILQEEGADWVCQGEAYVPVESLLRSMPASARRGDALPPSPGLWGITRGGELIRGGRVPMVQDVTALPRTAWDLIPPANYRAHHWHCFDRLSERSPYAALFTSFGCPYNCSYCSVNVVAGKPNLRSRSVDDILDEMVWLQRECGVRNLRILDNVFTARADRVEELCDRIISAGLDFNMWAYARVETVRDPALLVKMKKAGVNWLAYGIESANQKVRADVKKNTDLASIEKVLEQTQSAGIHIVGNFIFGLPEDDMSTMQMSFDMAKHYNFEWANFYCAMAYPGTALYDDMIRQGASLPSAWSAYSQYSADSHPLATRHLAARDVQAFRDRAFEEYYSSPRYLQMLETKFGPDAVAYVKHILSQPLRREKR